MNLYTYLISCDRMVMPYRHKRNKEIHMKRVKIETERQDLSVTNLTRLDIPDMYRELMFCEFVVWKTRSHRENFLKREF